MKINKSILIVGAAVIGLASCEPEMTQPTEEQIDAKVQELVSQRRSELQAQCDADLLAAANMEADKIIMASANQPAAAAPAPAPAPRAAAAPRAKAAPKPKPQPKAKAPEPKPEPKQNSKQAKMQGKAQNNVADKKAKMQGKQTEKVEDNLDKKKSKMRGGK